MRSNVLKRLAKLLLGLLVVALVLVTIITTSFVGRLPESPKRSNPSIVLLVNGSESESNPVSETAEMGREIDAESGSLGFFRSDIRWRSRPKFKFGDLPGDYDSLRSLALGGDGDAAWMLYQQFGGCLRAPPIMTEEDVETAISDIRQTHRIPKYDAGELVGYETIDGSNPNALVDRLQSFRRSLALCNDIEMEQRHEAEGWLAYAAENSDFEQAKIVYARSLNSAEGERILLDMWDDGDPRVLKDLIRISEARHASGADPQGHVRAEAFYLVRMKVAMEYFDYQGYPGSIIVAGLMATDNRDSELLHEHERNEAERLANKILGENENCCLILE